MNIVHLTDTYAPVVGGIERQVQHLAALQAAAGHRVTVVSGRCAPGPATTTEDGVLVRRPGRRRGPGHALPLHLDDMSADVFHAHLSVVSPGALRAAALVRGVDLPLAVSVHSMWPASGAPVRPVVRLAGLDSDRVAWSAVSAVAAGRVRATLSRGRVVDVVPNVVDAAWWRNPTAPGVSDDVRALFVGRLTHRKGVLRVIRHLARDWPADLVVTVVGDGPQRRPIADLVRRAGLERRVRLVGSRPMTGVRQLLHDGADLFVAPSALESFGIAALEARAAGVPVLARRGTGVEDFVRDGVDGWFADSAEHLAAGLAAFAAAPGQLRGLAAAARSTPPTVDVGPAYEAAAALYERARAAVPDRVGPDAARAAGGVAGGLERPRAA